MSIYLVTAPKHPTVSAAERADWAMLLARNVRRRREELGLSVKRAAELSGMETSDWYALEAGWVPLSSPACWTASPAAWRPAISSCR